MAFEITAAGIAILGSPILFPISLPIYLSV
jgi:hypothetical protein